MARNYKKIDLEEFQKDSFTRKEYFNSLNLNDIRYKCRIEMQMLPTIRKNQPSKYRKRNMSLSCPSCKYMTNDSNIQNTNNNTNKYPDTQNHLLNQCVAFSHIRQEIDTQKDEGVIQFFKLVVETRIEEGDD